MSETIVVLPFDSAEDAVAAARVLASEGWGVFVVRRPEVVEVVRDHARETYAPANVVRVPRVKP